MDHPLPLYTRVRLKDGEHPDSLPLEGVVMSVHNALDRHEPTAYTVAVLAETLGGGFIGGRYWLAEQVEPIDPPTTDCDHCPDGPCRPSCIGPDPDAGAPPPADAALLAKANRALAEQVKDLEERLDTAVLLVEEAYREGWDDSYHHSPDKEPEDLWPRSDAYANLHTEDGAPAPME